MLTNAIHTLYGSEVKCSHSLTILSARIHKQMGAYIDRIYMANVAEAYSESFCWQAPPIRLLKIARATNAINLLNNIHYR